MTYALRLGIKIRKILMHFASDYGSRYMWIKRPLAVFISALLDDKHQELYKNTPHYRSLHQ